MENREDLKSMQGLLPVVERGGSLFWPSRAVEALKFLSLGPHQSKVSSGEALFAAISDIRTSLSLHRPLPPSVSEGYALYFDELISRAEAASCFGEVVPELAGLLLRLPSLLETHYRNADTLLPGVETGLRFLGSQEPGIVFLSQELIAALLACAFFCLFPENERGAKYLPLINFDHLFESLYENYTEAQEHKIKCITHYFERISSCMPTGYVSFERKVLPLEKQLLNVSYPNAEFWSKSGIPLCPFEVHGSGFIEDQSKGALEVDFANKFLGGGALNRGCVQEEIRFMINPELIVGMLFLPCMEDNVAIEIVGAERFSDYTGYASSFRFSGDHVDKMKVDSFRRRKTRIIAIDALCSPGMRQYKLNYLRRETNKAFCGFYDQSKCNLYERLFHNQGTELEGSKFKHDYNASNTVFKSNHLLDESCSTSVEIEMREEECIDQLVGVPEEQASSINDEDKIGIATGNWGCGAFGGDPEVKSIIQWLAASQALRPFILYFTFGIESLQNLERVSHWILSHGWTVGELWNMLVEYSNQRYNKETNLGFFKWLLPSLNAYELNMSGVPDVP
ncbi:hypothetical protein Tsubulata_048180 [Turnera subulata]|uniref:poly(ADP-ribose) glycohydrolase n=1 Tax=Turnera subulata TaxID=218843 RepID=A0A9Q0EZS9_9ROSI|nr:hypothetical protein Tsubulata_048180 [Turnera subulata]